MTSRWIRDGKTLRIADEAEDVRDGVRFVGFERHTPETVCAACAVVPCGMRARACAAMRAGEPVICLDRTEREDTQEIRT